MKKVYYFIEDFALCFVLKSTQLFFDMMPLCLTYRVAELFGITACFLAFRRKKRLYKNLDIAYPEGCPFDKKKFAYKVAINFCYFMLDLFIAKRIFRKNNWKDIVTGEGLALMMDELGKHDKGIFVSGHFGSAVMFGHIMPLIGYPTMLVIRPVGPKRITKAIKELLGWTGQKIVLRKKAYQVFQEALQADDPCFPTILLDQHGGRKSLYVEFMGRKAYTAAGAAALARKHNVPIYVGVLARLCKEKYKFYAKKMLPIITDDKQKDLEDMTKEFNQYLAEYIKLHPEQWFWMHRRWR